MQQVERQLQFRNCSLFFIQTIAKMVKAEHGASELSGRYYNLKSWWAKANCFDMLTGHRLILTLKILLMCNKQVIRSQQPHRGQKWWKILQLLTESLRILNEPWCHSPPFYAVHMLLSGDLTRHTTTPNFSSNCYAEP